MDGNNMIDQQILTLELLDKELRILVEKKVISHRIADKIKQKIQKEKLTLSQTDLIKFIEHVQFLLNVKLSNDHDNQFIDNYQPSGDPPDYFDGPKTLQHDNSQSTVYPKETYKPVKKIETKRNEQKNVTSQTMNYPTIPLSEISNEPEHIIVLFKWLEYLIDKIGTEQLPTLLDYYVDIDWITKNVYMNLLKYAKGISLGGEEKAKQHQPVAFTINDHLQSFLFIQKLKGTCLPENFVGKIDSELKQMEQMLHHHPIP